MSVSWLRIKPVLTTTTLLAGIVLISGLVLRFAAPAASLQHILWQARYGLLAWRLCLYAVCMALFFSLYQRLSPLYRKKLMRLAGWALVLLVISEFSNALQWGEQV